ncbi:uncharacterized protein [Lepisosteus oculatus]|uniref:uncharacterized protein n=1 Tax=Lepisosteus oculatus TaxID=7918 RepID=UPI00371AC40A
MDVTLSVSFLKEHLSSTIEEAVSTAVETVLLETARLLGGKWADLQCAVAEKERENQSLRRRLPDEPEDGAVRPVRPSLLGGSRRKRRFHSRRLVSAPPKEEEEGGGEDLAFGAFPVHFPPEREGEPGAFAGDPAGVVCEEGQDVGVQVEWDLYAPEHHDSLSLAEEDGAAPYYTEDELQSHDLRIISVPKDDGMSEFESSDFNEEFLSFSPPQMKTEMPGMEALPGESAAELESEQEKERSGEYSEYVEQSFSEQLRGRLEGLAPEVIREYEKDSSFCELTRRKLIKIAVAYLVEEFGFYPTSAQKTMLAEHIVELFPALRLCVPSAGINGIEHLYDPVSRTGYIETRLRNFRRTLEADKKKYVLKRRRAELGIVDSKPGSNEKTSEEAKKWITLMKKTRPLAKNLTVIKNCMERTFSARRKWMVSKRPSLDVVIAEYPRFLDVPSAIDSEFERMFPGKGENFLSKWETCVLPKVRQIAEKEKLPEIVTLLEQSRSEKEDCYMLTMLKVLMHMLPPANNSRASQPAKSNTKPPINYLVDLAPIGTNISTLFCQPDMPRAGSHSQAKPRILTVGPLDSPSRRFFVLAPAERVVLPLPERSLGGAVDKLFKVLRVFNLGYPAPLAPLCSFLEYMYGIEKPGHSSGGKRTKVMELVSKLHMLP